MKKMMFVLMAMLVACTTSVMALDITLEDYESCTVGSAGDFSNPALYYGTVGTYVSATIADDAGNKYNEIVFDNTLSSGGWGFAVVPATNFIWPLDMSGATISFDINVSNMITSAAGVITPEIYAQAFHPETGNFIAYEMFRLPDASMLTLQNTSGWQTLTFNADDLTYNSARAAWKVMGNDIVWSLNIVFLNSGGVLNDISGTIGIDNIEVFGVTQIPEPASIILMIGAVLGLFVKKMK